MKAIRLLCLIACTATSALAQNTAAVQGEVVDSNGGPIPYRGQQISSQRKKTSIAPRPMAAKLQQPAMTFKTQKMSAFDEPVSKISSREDSFPLEESFRSF